MFDITKIPAIINHLKSISKYYKESSKEIIIFAHIVMIQLDIKLITVIFIYQRLNQFSTVSDVVLQERLFVC